MRGSNFFQKDCIEFARFITISNITKKILSKPKTFYKGKKIHKKTLT